MAEVQRGTKFVAWGIATGATGSGIGTFSPQSGDFKKDAKSVETPDGAGQSINITFYDKTQTFTLTVVPTATTITLAKAANILPDPGTIVTVTDADDPEVDTANAGKYVCMASSKKKGNTSANELTFELKQWTDADLAVASA